MNLNRVFLGGNLTRDPELSHTNGGTPVVSFGLAQNERWKNKDGEKQEKANFFEVEAYGGVAEVINEYFQKGKSIVVIGKLDYQTWEKDGQKRSTIRIKAQEFEFVGGKSESSNGSSSGTRNEASEVNEEDFEDIPF